MKGGSVACLNELRGGRGAQVCPALAYVPDWVLIGGTLEKGGVALSWFRPISASMTPLSSALGGG